MLSLVFQAGDQSFALDAKAVMEVVQLVSFRQIPGAPAWVAGLFQFRAQVAPAIDLTQLILGRPAHRRLSTRLIIVPHALSYGGQALVGLVAEHVTSVRRLQVEGAQLTSMAIPGAPHLGGVVADSGEMIQLVRVEELIPTELEPLLFSQPPQSLEPAPG